MAFLPEKLRRAISTQLVNAKRRLQLAPHPTPTIALYFADPLADVIGAEIQRLTPTVFASASAAVVIRYGGARDLAILKRRAFEKIYYVVDDDFFALADDDGLPRHYRERLLRYRDGPLRPLLEAVTHVVAPSEQILAHYRQKQCLRLDPALCHPHASLAHHRENGGLDMVFAATWTHRNDLEFMAPAFAEFLRECPGARLTTFLAGNVPKPLASLANARHLAGLNWKRYRDFVAQHRFHVAVAPALDTAFNRARSIGRLHDHAGFGAAGIYSAQPPFERIISHGNSGLLLANDPQAWLAALRDLTVKRQMAERLAVGGQALSRDLAAKARVRQFWWRELPIAGKDQG